MVLLLWGFASVWRKGNSRDPVLVGTGIELIPGQVRVLLEGYVGYGPSSFLHVFLLPSYWFCLFLFPSSFCSSIPLILLLMTQFAFSPACRGVTRLFSVLAALQFFIYRRRMFHLKYQSLLLDHQNPPILKQCLNSWDKRFSHKKQEHSWPTSSRRHKIHT